MLESTALVLVGVVNNPRDLEIARLLGWYRIPLRSAPKVIAVDYLAFYQTGAFGEEKWQIQYLAPVRGHELTTRAELLRTEPDHPRAKEEYYKLQIGALEKLKEPVKSDKWKRLTFLLTQTWLRLAFAGKYASSVHCISCNSSLYKAFKPRPCGSGKAH